MKSNSLKTIALILCVLTLLWCFYPQAHAWWNWKKIAKCIAASVALSAAVISMTSACGGAIVSILLDGGVVSSVLLSAACIGTIAYWDWAKDQVRKYCK